MLFYVVFVYEMFRNDGSVIRYISRSFVVLYSMLSSPHDSLNCIHPSACQDAAQGREAHPYGWASPRVWCASHDPNDSRFGVAGAIHPLHALHSGCRDSPAPVSSAHQHLDAWTVDLPLATPQFLGFTHLVSFPVNLPRLSSRGSWLWIAGIALVCRHTSPLEIMFAEEWICIFPAHSLCILTY